MSVGKRTREIGNGETKDPPRLSTAVLVSALYPAYPCPHTSQITTADSLFKPETIKRTPAPPPTYSDVSNIRFLTSLLPIVEFLVIEISGDDVF